MTTRDAELFGVLARGLTDDERRQVAEAITRVDDQADQQLRSSKGHDPTARQQPAEAGWTSCSVPHPAEKRTYA